MTITPTVAVVIAIATVLGIVAMIVSLSRTGGNPRKPTRHPPKPTGGLASAGESIKTGKHRYINQQTFNMTAIAMANTAMSSQPTSYELPPKAAEWVSSGLVQDPDLESDLVKSAERIVKIVREAPLPHAGSRFHPVFETVGQLHYCAENFNPVTAERLQHQWFAGLQWNRESILIEDKVEVCTANMIAFLAHVIESRIPRSPELFR